MNALRIAARWAFIVLLPVLLLTATVAWAFNSLWIYENGFVKYDVSRELGVSTEQLDRSPPSLSPISMTRTSNTWTST